MGAWETERAAIEQAPLSGLGNDADLPRPVRFGRKVIELVTRRESSADAEYDRPAAFVLLPREGFEHLPFGVVRQPLLHNGHHTLTGRVHFVNAALGAYSLVYEGDAAALFDVIKASSAGAFPTLIYSPKLGASTLSWFPQGVENETFELWSVSENPPTAAQITEVINCAYDGELVTPDQTLKDFQVWEDAEKGWAHSAAEARVQRTIRLALLGAFRRCAVRQEQSGKEGRTDLEIVEHRASNDVVHHAILELKVLKERGSTGNIYSDDFNAKHMREGLDQAYSYGEKRSFHERMLCCFDMRAINAGADLVLAPLRDDAKTLGVDLRHWFLYRSSQHWRQCTVAQVLANSARRPLDPH